MPRSKGKPAHEPAMIAELRSAIDDSGANCYQLANRAGIDEAAVRKFISRQRSLSLDSAARLAEALGLRLTRPAKPRKFLGKVRSPGPDQGKTPPRSGQDRGEGEVIQDSGEG